MMAIYSGGSTSPPSLQIPNKLPVNLFRTDFPFNGRQHQGTPGFCFVLWLGVELKPPTQAIGLSELEDQPGVHQKEGKKNLHSPTKASKGITWPVWMASTSLMETQILLEKLQKKLGDLLQSLQSSAGLSKTGRLKMGTISAPYPLGIFLQI